MSRVIFAYSFRRYFHALLGCILLISGCSETNHQPDSNSYSQQAQQIAKQQLIVDTHIDVPYRLNKHYVDISQASSEGEFDYPRAQAGGLNAAFMSIYTPAKVEAAGGAKVMAERLIDLIETIAMKSPQQFKLAYSSQNVQENLASGVISLALGMENGGPIEGDLSNVKYFFERGIRYITLTHSKSNHISDSSYDENKRWQGLSPFGKKLVVEMNAVGIMVDISHVSDQAFYQVMEISQAPVIASHSSVRHFTPGFERNMSDDMIRLLADKDGVIQINFGSSFLTKEALAYDKAMRAAKKAYLQQHNWSDDSTQADKFELDYRQAKPYPYASIEHVIEHIEYVIQLVGIDYVGLGSDFDGVGDSLPKGLKSVADYPNLIAGLLQRGYSEPDISKILSGNLMRVWQAVEASAAKHTSDDPLAAALEKTY